MHIVHFPSWYSTPSNPVRGSFFREQALALHKSGHTIGMIIPPGRVRTLSGLDEIRRYWTYSSNTPIVEADSGMYTYRIPWWGFLPTFSRSRRAHLALAVFDQYCREHGRPDVLHGHSALYGGFLAAWIGQQRAIPVVFTEYATWILQGPILPGQHQAVRFTLEHSHRCLTIGSSLVDALHRFMPGKPIEPFGTNIDTNFFSPSEEALPHSPFIFSVIAHLMYKKRIDILLDAFALAFKDQPVHLNIGGDGTERAKLEKHTRDLGLDQQVTFLGRLDREAVRDLIRRSHAVVSSSHVETFGITMAEAMACGKPIVATRSGGPEFFVNEVNGLLVERDNAAALADGMKRLYETYARYDPVAIRRECVVRFSDEAILRRLEAIYESVLTRETKRA